MTARERALGKILRAGLLPNLIHDRIDPEMAVDAVIAAGVRAVEVSCRRPDTLALIKRLRARFPDLAIGVSSLIEDGPYFRFLQERGPRFPSIQEAADAGADFLVSVITFSSETYRRFDHLPIIPGVTGADEAKRQLDLGAALVKFNNLGAPAFKALNGGPIHFGLPLLVTGGVRPEHIDALVGARMLVCVSGFDVILTDRYAAVQQAFDAAELTRRAGEYVTAFAEARRVQRPGVDFASGDPRVIQRQSGQFMNMR